jgi:AcrR family transcriptional regulator
MTVKRRRRKVVPDLPGTSRRAQYSASTKRAMVEAALGQFAEKGYAATSLDAIVAEARVTKGALYHHFSGKQALFEAVFERVSVGAATDIAESVKGIKDPWEKSITGLRGFLAVVQDPTYRRVVLQEGPAVLGHERYREHEERSAYAIVQDVVADVLAAGSWDLDDAMVDTFSRIFFGALASVGESVAGSEDPEAASLRAEAAIGFILRGLQSLMDQGVLPADPVQEPDAAAEQLLDRRDG